MASLASRAGSSASTSRSAASGASGVSSTTASAAATGSPGRRTTSIAAPGRSVRPAVASTARDGSSSQWASSTTSTPPAPSRPATTPAIAVRRRSTRNSDARRATSGVGSIGTPIAPATSGSHGSSAGATRTTRPTSTPGPPSPPARSRSSRPIAAYGAAISSGSAWATSQRGASVRTSRQHAALARSRLADQLDDPAGRERRGSAASSSARPTSGGPSRSSARPASSAGLAGGPTRRAATGARRPFTWRGSTGVVVNPAAPARARRSPTRIWPGLAVDIKRAATFVASPIAMNVQRGRVAHVADEHVAEVGADPQRLRRAGGDRVEGSHEVLRIPLGGDRRPGDQRPARRAITELCLQPARAVRRRRLLDDGRHRAQAGVHRCCGTVRAVEQDEPDPHQLELAAAATHVGQRPQLDGQEDLRARCLLSRGPRPSPLRPAPPRVPAAAMCPTARCGGPTPRAAARPSRRRGTPGRRRRPTAAAPCVSSPRPRSSTPGGVRRRGGTPVVPTRCRTTSRRALRPMGRAAGSRRRAAASAAVAIAARASRPGPRNSTTIASPPNSSTSPPCSWTSAMSPPNTSFNTSLTCSAPARPRRARRSASDENPEMSKHATVASTSNHRGAADVATVSAASADRYGCRGAREHAVSAAPPAIAPAYAEEWATPDPGRW